MANEEALGASQLTNNKIDRTSMSEHEDRPSVGYRLLTILTDSWILLVLFALVVVFAILNPAFITLFNIRNVINDASILLIMAIGQTFVMIAGGLDLSVGSVLVFSGVVAAKIMGSSEIGGAAQSTPQWIAIALVAAIVSGAAWGVLNGVLITRLKLPPLIVTLGTLGMALGSAQIITEGIDLSGVPDVLVNSIGLGKVAGIPVLVIIAAALSIIAALVLRFTRFGRYTYAIGSNVDAARRVGISVNSHLIKLYAIQGLLAGVAGIMALTRYTTTTIGAHGQDNLAVISGVVLGGTSLFGGYGSILGTVVGILIPVVLANGLQIVGVQSFWQTVVIGAILIVAVFVDRIKRNARASGS
jgi:ribose transport system permease protein